jgi:hypothetical protein
MKLFEPADLCASIERLGRLCNAAAEMGAMFVKERKLLRPSTSDEFIEISHRSWQG